MAYESGHSYWFKPFSAPSKALSVYGDTQVSQNRNVILWDKQTVADQIWRVDVGTGFARIKTTINTTYALNVWRGSSNFGNCDIHTWADNTTDSQVDFRTINGGLKQYRIVLVSKVNGAEFYLTAKGTSNGADVRWEPFQGSEAYTQKWELEEYGGGGGSSGTGGGAGPLGNYVYPTMCKEYRGGYTYTHPALDIRDCSSDHSVYAFADGIVSFTQNSTGSWIPDTTAGREHVGTMDSMGNCIAINHYNPISTSVRAGKYARSIYMHMLYNPTLRPGDSVVKGQVIGTIGSTGLSSGNHLHFSLSTGDAATMAPGAQNWIGITNLPDFDPSLKVLPDYHAV